MVNCPLSGGGLIRTYKKLKKVYNYVQKYDILYGEGFAELLVVFFLVLNKTARSDRLPLHLSKNSMHKISGC